MNSSAQKSPVSSPGITEQLANCVAAVSYDALPQDVIAVAKTVTLDGVANMLAGSVQPLGEIVINSFTDERRFSRDIEQLLGKIRVVEDKNIPSGLDWPRTWANVTVKLKDGRTLHARCDKPKGRGDRPLTRDEHLAKFRDCARRVLSPEDIDRVIELVENIDQLKDLKELLARLRAGP